jgi:hypothetical protein
MPRPVFGDVLGRGFCEKLIQDRVCAGGFRGQCPVLARVAEVCGRYHTVQPKAVTEATRAFVMSGRNRHAKQMKRAKRQERFIQVRPRTSDPRYPCDKAQELHDRPYDGHTLKRIIPGLTRLTGIEPHASWLTRVTVGRTMKTPAPG